MSGNRAFVIMACAAAEPITPSCVAAIVAAAVPRKRRRRWLMSSAILVVSMEISWARWLCNRSAEREREGFHVGIEKFDFELPIGDGLRLSDQLVQPLLGHLAIALFIDVASVRCAWRLSIDQHAKSHRRSWRFRAHDKMKIAGVETVGYTSIGLVQRGSFSLDGPIARQSPFI